MAEVSPCPYPGCRDIDGNPRLTRDVICEPSRRHYRLILDRLALHYVLLRRDLPRPAAQPGERVMRVVAKEYGHPAEWASDTARAIADQLGLAHEGLAEVLGHDGPPHEQSREHGRVAISYRYLTNWFDQLCTYAAAADTAEALYDLDRHVRRGLGKTNPQRHLPVPCPSCDLLTLVRNLDLDGTDLVECRACDEIIPADRYAWWTRTLLDEMDNDPPLDAAS